MPPSATREIPNGAGAIGTALADPRQSSTRGVILVCHSEVRSPELRCRRQVTRDAALSTRRAVLVLSLRGCGRWPHARPEAHEGVQHASEAEEPQRPRALAFS